MIFDHSSYRSYLKEVLVARQQRNPAYSLRAFAKDLALSASYVSTLLRGTRGLSLESGVSLSRKLKLSPEATEYFCLLVQLESTTEPLIRSTLHHRMRVLGGKSEKIDLNVEVFKMISEWYHIPIVEMLELESFPFNVKSIAEHLGISVLQAEFAIARLEKLELIEKNEHGTYVKIQDNYLFRSVAPNVALRHFHRQMLTKAADSLENQTNQEKYVGSQTFAFDPDQLSEASALIEEFRKKMVDLTAKGVNRRQVYHLGIQLFNLSQKKSEGKSKNEKIQSQ